MTVEFKPAVESPLQGFKMSDKQRLKLVVGLLEGVLKIDVSRFKVGRVYHIRNSDNLMMINDIGHHPVSRVPTAYGFQINTEGHSPHYIELYELGKEFV